MEQIKLSRGDIMYVKADEFPPCDDDYQPEGYKPVVVVTSNQGCKTSPLIMVCPLSARHRLLSCNANVFYKKEAQAICNRVTCVARNSLLPPRTGNYRLTKEEMQAIDAALVVAMGINRSER